MGLLDKLKKQKISNDIVSICDGNVIDIVDVKDEVFSSCALGKGIGIQTKQKQLYSPVTGEITVAFPTKHAIGIKTKAGIEILIHIGIDTVELNGEGFHSFIKQGQKIKQGELLCEVDFDFIENKGYDTTIMVVVTNSDDYSQIKNTIGERKTGEVIISIEG